MESESIIAGEVENIILERENDSDSAIARLAVMSVFLTISMFTTRQTLKWEIAWIMRRDVITTRWQRDATPHSFHTADIDDMRSRRAF
jgi:hypothetical protein